MSGLDLKRLIPQSLSKEDLLAFPYCLLPLFHGTDKAILSMSQEERDKLRFSCATVIDYLLPIYEENEFEKRTSQENSRDLQEIHGKVVDVRGRAALRKTKNSLYSYNNVYLSFNPAKAHIYALCAWVCSELGYIAHWLLLGAEKLGYELPTPTYIQKQALEAVRVAGARKPEPILVCYLGIPKERLLTERGNPINWESQIDNFLKNFHHGDVRVLGDFDISSGVTTHLQELEETYGN